MTMREDLEKVIGEVNQADASQSDYDFASAGDNAFYLIRDHGLALLEAVRDAERYRWLRDASDCEIEVYIPTDKNPSGYGAWHSCGDKDAAIDAARDYTED